ncbi:MAG: Type I Iterative PKS [Caeruleum heppii]|nr:MAG: Type I Iterative PKS [Caeruleum heppii]
MTINDSELGRPHLGRSFEHVSSRPPTTGDVSVPEPIAVVGMACRLPGDSNSPHALWNLLKRGGVANNEAPLSRFDLKTHHDGSKKPKTMRSPGGMFLENIDPRDFDAQFFSISRTDAIAMDPQQRQLLEVVYECLENAGISLESLDGAPVGCFVGSYAVDYADIQARDPEDRAPSVTVGVGRAILSNRLSHFLNIKGPSMTIDTACSGSLVSLDVACRYLKTGEINGAIVAGANLYLSPEHNMDGGAMKGASSLSGKCHTFDVKADGYIKAEGINAVVLKRLSDAVRDRDAIRAIIRGSATNSDGRTPGIASPSSEAQATAIRAAYANAGITDYSETIYLECHGTGTQAGDPTEVAGAASVFAAKRPSEKPLIIGSIKSNIGHSEPAAGISGLLKTILILENGVIPGNPTFVTPNPKIDFEALRVRATRTAIPWPRDSLRRASVNSFGYGGSNAHVVLDDAKSWAKMTHVSSYLSDAAKSDFFGTDNEIVSLAPHLLVLSANDENSLRAYVKSLRKHLMNPDVKIQLPDLAYTLSHRKTQHFHRAFLVDKSTELQDDALVFGKKSAETPRVGFVFTGQGAQWSQMGKQLLETYPEMKKLVQRLDEALQTSATPPSWSLLTELTEARSPTILRQPEFSQPLVTALQLVIMSILRKWGIHPQAVIGHSSGEIAAACAAGLLTEEDAIRAAFYRGQASKQSEDKTPVGMMAVGLGPAAVTDYLQGHSELVKIACYNSPNSVTLSGSIAALEEIKTRLVEDSHFARLLQVNLAYHSKFMTEISQSYADLLHRDFKAQPFSTTGSVQMFSSVFGRRMDRTADAQYWQDNMTSPVLFDQALREMLTCSVPPTFLIEIGPSGALAGPVSQIMKTLSGGGANVQYCPALSRGQEAIKSTFEVAGRLFVAGGSVNLAQVNQYASSKPRFIVDLPGYSWNHSTQYWYESEASKDWRYRMFPHHDLLGSKILNSSYHVPTWKKTLQVEDLPWLRDHKMGPEIVFPAAGFMAMGIEAMYQSSQALSAFEGKTGIEKPRYRLRDVTFPKALVLEEGKKHQVMLTLNPRSGTKNSWHEYKVFSLTEQTWNEHSRGLVRIEECTEEVAPAETLRPLVHTTSGQMWYKAMEDAGYGFGPLFQKQLEVEAVSGQRESRSMVSLEVPSSEYPQSSYPMHPACIDGCLQTCAPSLWKGNRSSVSAVLVPAIIDDVLIVPHSSRERAISSTSASYVGLGRREETKNYMSDASVYDVDDGSLLFRVSGLRYHKLDTREDPYAAHKYSCVTWKPDIRHLTQDGMDSVLRSTIGEDDAAWAKVHEVIDLAAHKTPNLRVLEAVLIPEETGSIWLDGISSQQSLRAAARKFQYSSIDATALIATQDKYGSSGHAEFSMLDLSKIPNAFVSNAMEYDLIVVRLGAEALPELTNVIQNVHTLLADQGRVLFVQQARSSPESVLTNGTNGSIESATLAAELEASGFHQTLNIPSETSSLVQCAHLATATAKEPRAKRASPVDIVRFSCETASSASITKALEQDLGWKVGSHDIAVSQVSPGSLVLVLDDLSSPILPSIRDDQWQALQTLLGAGNRVLWVTKGSQMEVTNPNGAMIHGLARTVRAEDPSVSITTLDVDSVSSTHTLAAIDRILCVLEEPAPKTHVENEYVDRNGVTYVSRVQPDHQVNQAEKDDRDGADLVTEDLHAAEACIRMRCERLGTIDSLCFAEVAQKELPLGDNRVEVELEAAGLNFKDVAITMGIVPENQYLLGLEGAGTIRRAGSTQYKVGQRVLVFEKGTLGNRIIATTERVYPIPASMSFEEASTLASVYLTALYSLFDLANTQKGQRVLIHSASGGLGIASIQLCHYIGAEVYATVGNDEKRKFLTETFGIPASNIFNSRSTAFASEIMRVTNGEGVDVILNSLTGDLLEESWRCIREGGTMVELGKRDMLDRGYLPMAPFGRNVLLKQLFGLIEAGHVKPISPIKTFSFEDIPSAFRYMRGANHIGKIVISDKGEKANKVPVRPSPREFSLRADVSYLIVGGLKGLCGSLAIQLARLGARHLVVLSRSGYDDKLSQGVLRDIEAEGAKIDLARGDVSVLEDVRRTFKQATVPIGGIIQGAMVLRDKIFTAMTISEYYGAVRCKLDGTWNLHQVALEESLPLDFFTMLSSISGVVGQKGQANYAAANVFLDAFAAYRRKLGLPACSVDLGAIEEVGYMSRNVDLLVALDKSAWTPINEALFHKIVRFSIEQQVAPLNEASGSQLITSIALPQYESSKLLVDARFGGLCFGDTLGSGAGGDNKDGSREIQAFFLLVSSGADPAAMLNSAIEVVNRQFMTMLRLTEALEPGKPLSSYGLDSLAAVEFRNWVRVELGAELTTLEISNASSLIGLCEKIVGKVQQAQAHQAANAKAS